MGITVGSYFSLYDKRAELAQIYKKYGAMALFIVPARLDRDFMLELICGDEPGFGARPAVWTVGDLLLELQRATKEYERIIDPPDHKLILRWLLSEFLAEAEEKGAALEPGYSHAGFVSVLGENIKDLLAEEVSAECGRLESSGEERIVILVEGFGIGPGLSEDVSLVRDIRARALAGDRNLRHPVMADVSGCWSRGFADARLASMQEAESALAAMMAGADMVIVRGPGAADMARVYGEELADL